MFWVKLFKIHQFFLAYSKNKFIIILTKLLAEYYIILVIIREVSSNSIIAVITILFTAEYLTVMLY